MSKQEQFLWIVQTTILANGINLASTSETDKQYRDVFSASATIALADEALRASELIPEKKSVFDAASEFCTFMLRNLNEAEEMANGNKLTVPYWFSRF